jgi:glyoxylase-like metal-dependent hydrolase (beta-lactamase superfamily II)
VPGHTATQTAVYLPDEGVVFTGDNVFYRVKTWIREADPWDWLAALRHLGELDVTVISPGHGEPCEKSYLREQAEIIEAWVGAVGEFVRRGMTEEEAVAQPAPRVDPYPIHQREFARSEWVDRVNVANLYRRLVGRG